MGASLDSCRRRHVTTLGRRLAPLDRRDLRDNNLDVEWPLSFDELSGHYPRAAAFLQRSTGFTSYHVPFLDTEFRYKPFSIGTAIRAHEAFGERLRGDPNVVVLTCHTAVKLGAPPSRKFVSTLHIRSLSESVQMRLSPRHVLVLACGGLGNARVLLQPGPDATTPVGNESGLVGRFLMEHPHTKVADMLMDRTLLPAPPDDLGALVTAFIPEDTFTSSTACWPAPWPSTESPSRAATGADELALQRVYGRPLYAYSLYARSEQEPSTMNGVSLVNETDWAGSYKLEVHHSYSHRDLRSMEQSTRLFGEKLAERRIGAVKVDQDSILSPDDRRGTHYGDDAHGDEDSQLRLRP